MTLVMEPSAPPVRSLWAIMDCTDIEAAAAALRVREGMSPKRSDEIGRWSKGQNSPEAIFDLPEWAASRGIESVVWTALPAKFAEEEGKTPTLEQVLEHLRALRGAARDTAERYVRRTPRQIDTPYRRAIEAALHWTHRGDSNTE